MKNYLVFLVLLQISGVQPATIISVEEVNPGVLERYDRSAGTTNDLQYNANCESKYKNITVNHTMCLVDVGVSAPLSQEEKDAALKAHNDYRANVTPTATNMMKMVWDDELAAIATKWALQCTVSHDKGLSRRAPSLPRIYVGQNAAGGQSSLVAAVDNWYAEVSNFAHGTGSTNGKDTGHYTQVVFHDSSKLGCGKANCPDSTYGMYYICNYAFGQRGDLKEPYESGNSCAECSDKCTNNLCDCDGKLCYNSGVLDINTCTCTCKDVYSGDNCETVQCSNTEKFWCSNSTLCDIYSNYHYDCNMLCGTCPYPCDGKQCLNSGSLDIESCNCNCQAPYIGDTCAEKNCTGTEKWWCDQFHKDDCTKYSNFPTDCNIKCGVCPKPK